MTLSFEQSKNRIAQLVKQFQSDRDYYLEIGHKEDQTRQLLINPFFEALGWDIHNRKGLPPNPCDVLVETSVEIDGQKLAPDYVFRVRGIPKFFVEAKKPRVRVKEDIGPAYQLRTYCWSAKLAFSILTDFEELSVYDCRVRPHWRDRAGVARIAYFKSEEYVTRWHEIWNLFSYDAVVNGSVDEFLLEEGEGTSTVDAEFLKEIESWRDAIAINIALRNPGIGIDELNDATMRLIDWIVFLRIAEARGVEPPKQLLRLADRGDAYAGVLSLAQKADAKYNAGLFDFRSAEVKAMKPLSVDPKVIRDIIKSLYFPTSPYQFRVMPADILGNVYEQFLGRVIRLSPAHKAFVEDKPEVIKAGGVYYTPTYVVDYIVSRSVGGHIKGKSPVQLKDFRILDPACGSGSFLLAAYQYLLNHHLDWYSTHNPQRYRNAVQKNGNSWQLTLGERKRILVEHIFGVDIDRQAVEVTKLSLLLQVLDDGITYHQSSFLNERILPNLDTNIRCGNSLIGPDYYTGQESEAELKQINPFDWSRNFRDIIQAGGFDCIIGNPPYRRELDYKELMDPIAKTSWGKKYRSPRMDLWYYFVHRCLELLQPSGALSFIVNAYWISGTGAEKLVKALATEAHVEEIFFLSKLKVFQNVSGQHMIFRIRNSPSKAATTIKLVQPRQEKSAASFIVGRSQVMEFKKSYQELFPGGKVDIMPSAGKLLSKIESETRLDEFGIIRQGIAENPASINRKTNERFKNRWVVGQGVFALRPRELAKLGLPKQEKNLIRPYHDLADVGRYYLAETPSLNLIYSTRVTCPDINEYPTIREHLRHFKPIMEARRETLKGANSWWHLHWPRDESIWKSPKIISIQMARRPSFVPASLPVYVPFSANVFVPFDDTKEHLNYICAILNSRLLWKWYQHYAKRRGIGLEINGNVLARSPIRAIDFSKPADVKIHDHIVGLVNKMLDLNRRLDAIDEKRTQDKQRLQELISSVDAEIDETVYKLYGLTQEERETVERDTEI